MSVTPARVGLVGATGLVGTEMLRLLEARAFPVDELRAFASPRSVGRKLPFAGGDVECRVLDDGCFDGLDLVVIDVDDPLALEWAPRAVAAGARVVDKSAAFRMEPDVPLVIAEVNPDDVRDMPRGIVSSPNCTTTVPLVALAPLHRAAGIRRMVVSSYQSVSGAGQPGVHELDEQWTKGAGQADRFLDAGARGPLEPGEVWDRPIAGNVIPKAGSVKEGGYTSEEWKMVRETRKILHAPDIQVSCTCVRVPVYVGHGVTVNVQFERALSKADAVELLTDAPGVQLVDGGAGAPTPMEAAGIDPVLVGRLREDPSQENTLDLWATGDNLRKGAALNGIQLLELLLAT
ncbi:MAG TPA: aspartate-semialdehyde dehydrogenase [Acidimicrobiia bacterium]|nr:aspartate-semialdehyde dehydrogenase [Acidimicrobiia bacterium]